MQIGSLRRGDGAAAALLPPHCRRGGPSQRIY